MGPQTLRRCKSQLPTGEGLVSDPEADPRVDQPPPGRGAATPPTTYLDALKAPGAKGLANSGGLSPKGERGAKD